MYSAILEEIGLSPNEAKIYETLLSTGESSVTLISDKAHVHRRNIYDAISRLIEKGLVFPIFQKGENRYQAVQPEKLLELVKQKETKLKGILPKLKDLYDDEPTESAAYIYKGLEGYKHYRMDLLRNESEAFFLGAKGLWRSPAIDETFRKMYIEPFNQRKTLYKVLFDPRIPEILPEAIKDVKGQWKVLPKGYETQGVVDIFGDYVVTFTSVGVGNIGEDATLFVMKNKELAETYKTWFRMIWDMLPEKKKK